MTIARFNPAQTSGDGGDPTSRAGTCWLPTWWTRTSAPRLRVSCGGSIGATTCARPSRGVTWRCESGERNATRCASGVMLRVYERCRTRSAGWAATCGATAARATRVPCPCRRQGPRGPGGSSQYPGREQGAEVRVAAPNLQVRMLGPGDDVGRTRIVAREAQHVFRIRRVEHDR